MLRKRYLIKHMHAELGDYMNNPSRKMSRDMSLRHLSKGIQISDAVSSSWLTITILIAMDRFQHLLYLGCMPGNFIYIISTYNSQKCCKYI